MRASYQAYPHIKARYRLLVSSEIAAIAPWSHAQRSSPGSALPPRQGTPSPPRAPRVSAATSPWPHAQRRLADPGLFPIARYRSLYRSSSRHATASRCLFERPSPQQISPGFPLPCQACRPAGLLGSCGSAPLPRRAGAPLPGCQGGMRADLLPCMSTTPRISQAPVADILPLGAIRKGILRIQPYRLIKARHRPLGGRPARCPVATSGALIHSDTGSSACSDIPLAACAKG